MRVCGNVMTLTEITVDDLQAGKVIVENIIEQRWWNRRIKTSKA
jgi:hypothetical protein